MSESFTGEIAKTAVSQYAVTNKQRDVLTKHVKAGQQTVVATEPNRRDGGSRDVITAPRPVPFEVAGSSIRWGSEVRPTPRLKRPLLALRESWCQSLGQVLVAELGSFVCRIGVRTKNHMRGVRAVIPPWPPCLREQEGFRWCDFLRACRLNTTQLQTEHPWMGLLDVQTAVQSWIAGIEYGVRVCSELRYRESPTLSPIGGGHSMPPEVVQQSAIRGPLGQIPLQASRADCRGPDRSSDTQSESP